MRHLAAIVVLALAPTAFGELVANGSFEADTVSGPGAPAVENLSSGLTGWTISGDIDLIGTYWQSSPDGGNSLDLSGSGVGSITQTLDGTGGTTATVIGQQYILRFYMAGNPDGGPQPHAMSVAATGMTTQNLTFNSSGTSTAAMGWVPYAFIFTASSTSTVLTFATTDSTGYGPALDGVSVTEAPEPAALWMFAIGIGGLGLWRRYGKRRPATSS